MISWGEFGQLGQRVEPLDLPNVVPHETRKLYGGKRSTYECSPPALKLLSRQESQPAEGNGKPLHSPLLGPDALHVLEKWHQCIMRETQESDEQQEKEQPPPRTPTRKSSRIAAQIALQVQSELVGNGKVGNVAPVSPTKKDASPQKKT